MARGATFTNDEDDMIHQVFSNGGPVEYKYRKIQEYIAEHSDLNIPPLRRYNAYVARWRHVRTSRQQIQDSPEPSSSSSPAPKKRKIENMGEEELMKYEAKILKRIKMRKEEITMEKNATPECPVCMVDIDDPVIACCGHVFCVQCYCKVLSRDLVSYDQMCHVCPICRADWNKPDKVIFMEKSSTVAECKSNGAIISV